MSWKREAFLNFKLYAVTNIQAEEEKVLAGVRAVCLGGADIIQLRSKELSDGALYRIGLKMRKVTEEMQKLFFVNDRVDLALALDADGIHVGQDDIPVNVVRRLASMSGKEILVGKSTHNLQQGLEALRELPDYLGVGPVFETPTKPNYQPAGLEYVRQAALNINIPFVAIGGINSSNLGQVIQAGARRIAVVRAVFDAADPQGEAEKLKKILEGAELCQKF